MTTIDLKLYLDPISTDAPSGADLGYEPVFVEMEQVAGGKPERQVGDLVIPAQEPDWRQVGIKAEEVLARSKDLRAAILLTRAQMHLNGFAGLSDGLSLIRGFIEQYWESVHPQLDPHDDNDPTIRINTLMNLCDPIEVLKVINEIPLVGSPVFGNFCLRDIQIAEGTLIPSGEVTRKFTLEQVDGAFRECPPERTHALLAQIRQAIVCVSAIEKELNQRLGIDQSPSLQKLFGALSQAEKEIVTRSGETLGPVDDAAADPASPGLQPVGSRAPGAVRNREDVIRTLEHLCLYYEQNEPSSPVPLLLKRAKRLVRKDFFDIVQDLAPDGSSHFEFLWKQEKTD